MNAEELLALTVRGETETAEIKRVGAVTAQMDRQEYERLLLACRQLPFDRRAMSDATLDDLDEAKLRWHLQQAAQERAIPVDLAAPLAENLKRLGVAAERDGRLVLTTALHGAYHGAHGTRRHAKYTNGLSNSDDWRGYCDRARILLAA